MKCVRLLLRIFKHRKCRHCRKYAVDRLLMQVQIAALQAQVTLSQHAMAEKLGRYKQAFGELPEPRGERIGPGGKRL
jgi:hypothetical protein